MIISYQFASSSALPRPESPTSSTIQKSDLNESDSYFGALKATNFELLHSIAEWLFENSEPDAFKLPHMTIKQRSQQMAEAVYDY